NLFHLRKTDLFATVMPSKIFESAGCWRPMIIGVGGFAEKLVLDAQAGIAMEPENAKELVGALVRLADDHALGARLGQNAHDYIAKIHNRNQQALDYLAVLRKAIKQ
ncbi:MAG: glycosyltransferase WbuB, partial [Kiritimatiellae bacterium]|nr:glycosyltransferase WbuB [Kiritimatiellia bacterium]